MLKIVKKMMVLALALAAPLAAASAAPQVGQPAPLFTGVTAAGGSLDLAALKGKTVVLEWTNKDCPYVGKHYGTGNMQKLQKRMKSQHGVTWISIISSAPGRQGYLEPDEALANVKETDAAPDHVVLDPEGIIGQAYGAVTTPHMYIIDAKGVLRFMGGIDDKPTANWRSVEGAHNHVEAALADLAAGRAVKEPMTRPYGCTVKYAY